MILRHRLHHGTRSSLASRRRARPGARGQSLVEFALVFPIFMTLLMAIIEFAFVFNAILAVNYAARMAALTASEAGNATGSDCIVLAGIETNVSAPADHGRIVRVEVSRTTRTGALFAGSAPTVWVRGATTTTCTIPGLGNVTVPYVRTSNGYPEADRCNVLSGCVLDSNGLAHTGTVDHIGIKIVYDHVYKTPIHTIFSGPTLTFDRANSMRMEPIH
jgi:Flp pilus assembly protein TadG